MMEVMTAELIGPTVLKCCPICREQKTIERFQRQLSGRYARHSYCKDCYNAKARQTRKAGRHKPENRRRWHMKSRYGMTEADVERMLAAQGGACAVCECALEKFHIDHCHNSGAVRGLICHRCNIRLGGWDDLEWREKAMRYLGIIQQLKGAM